MQCVCCGGCGSCCPRWAGWAPLGARTCWMPIGACDLTLLSPGCRGPPLSGLGLGRHAHGPVRPDRDRGHGDQAPGRLRLRGLVHTDRPDRQERHLDPRQRDLGHQGHGHGRRNHRAGGGAMTSTSCGPSLRSLASVNDNRYYGAGWLGQSVSQSVSRYYGAVGLRLRHASQCRVLIGVLSALLCPNLGGSGRAVRLGGLAVDLHQHGARSLQRRGAAGHPEPVPNCHYRLRATLSLRLIGRPRRLPACLGHACLVVAGGGRIRHSCGDRASPTAGNTVLAILRPPCLFKMRVASLTDVIPCTN